MASGILMPLPSGPFGPKFKQVNLASQGSTWGVSCKAQFAADVWANPSIEKIVRVPPGVELGSDNPGGYAMHISPSADGQAGSFAGKLTIIIEAGAFISGRGGNANSGVGGTALFANILGRSGQKATVINRGTLRGGGGGGGQGGTGGRGGGGYWDNAYWQWDPGDASWLYSTSFAWQQSLNGVRRSLFWGSTTAFYQGDIGDATEVSPGDGWTYERGALMESTIYRRSWQIRRRYWRSDRIWTEGGWGGGGGAGGRGGGWGLASTVGSGGAGGTAGGTNAGAGGTGGTGGTGGSYGNSGGSGATGNTGGGGWAAGGGGGSPGAAGGLAGYYINGLNNINLQNSGTLQGRGI